MLLKLQVTEKKTRTLSIVPELFPNAARFVISIYNMNKKNNSIYNISFS